MMNNYCRLNEWLIEYLAMAEVVMEKQKTWQVPGCTEQGVNCSRAKQKGKCGELIRANKDGNLEREIRRFQFLTQSWSSVHAG